MLYYFHWIVSIYFYVNYLSFASTIIDRYINKEELKIAIVNFSSSFSGKIFILVSHVYIQAVQIGVNILSRYNTRPYQKVKFKNVTRARVE